MVVYLSVNTCVCEKKMYIYKSDDFTDQEKRRNEFILKKIKKKIGMSSRWKNTENKV